MYIIYTDVQKSIYNV